MEVQMSDVPETRQSTLADAVQAGEVAGEGARSLVRLDEGMKERVEQQADAFIQGLLAADVHSEDFKKRIDSAFRLGRREIAEATRLNTAFLRRNYRGIESSPAYQAMAELREIMDDLDPGRQGSLLEPVRILGLIPGGTRLKSYFRKFESASGQIDRLVHQLTASQDDLERDAIAIEDAKVQLWAALQNLKAAAHFAQVLQQKLAAHVDGLKATDPLRARALEQEALYYAAQNLDGILAQLAVSVNGYLALDPLKKIARELSNGIDRLKTTGMSALAIAQMVAVATGNQVRIQQAMARTREVVGNLTVRTSAQLGEHARTVGKSAADPAIEIGKLQAAFDNTFKAMDTMDGYRSAAIQTLGKNAELLQALIEKARPYLERAASGPAAARVDPALVGPVAL
jgi:uncharacterized protein YaaN involved in tellurite resistance